MEYPELAARTRRFTYGAPRAIALADDGSRVVFLRSGGPEDPADRLYVFDLDTGTERLVADPARLLAGDDTDLPAAERALRERLRLSTGGIGSYAIDPTAQVAAFALGGRLFRADLSAGTVTELPAAGPVLDPRPDPTGARVAYVTTGTLRVVAPADPPPGEDPATGGDATRAPADPQAGTGGTGAADGRTDPAAARTGRSAGTAGTTWSDTLIAGEPDATWGQAEFIAAEEFGRFRGYWWAPDGRHLLAARVDESRVPRWTLHDPASPQDPPTTVAYPHAGATNAEVTLHLLDLDGGWVDVHWDRETYPYLAAVSWSDSQPATGGPLITVLRRSQQHGLVLAIDQRTGETQVHAELADPRWVEPLRGTPAYLPDGRVLVGGELAHDGYDARCLFADGTLLTPPGLYVRRVAGQLDEHHLLVEASEGEPSEVHLYRVGAHGGAPTLRADRITTEPGWHTGYGAGDTMVIGSAGLDHAGIRWAVYRGGQRVGELANLAARPPYAPRPVLERVTDRRLPTGVLYPRSHVAGRKLPVLVDVYGGPGHQEVMATRGRWQEKQWWADAGFAVVVIDNRGTPGVAPGFEKAIHHRMADVVLGDQVDALLALAGKHPDLDLDRVAMRGWSFGGWLAGLAVLRRPDVYRAAVAGAPVTDWKLYDTAYTERYLGLPDDGRDVYQHHSLVDAAAERPASPADARPMLLIHGLVDDNVVAAHTLRLSAALLAAGRPHWMIPLSGATHMAAGGLAERLLRIELDFLRGALAG